VEKAYDSIYEPKKLCFCSNLYLTTSQKVLSMTVIPEVRNRESIFFKKLRAPGFPPFLLGEPAGAGAGMTTFYKFIKFADSGFT
jgi:hypothetical protein